MIPAAPPSAWPTFAARVVPGHRVASGLNGDPRFPGGTVAMQRPHFLARGLDLAGCHPGTVNVSVAPGRWRLERPRHTFRGVRWHPVEPAEDFSFAEVQLLRPGAPAIAGWIYHPHPETKPEHFQTPDILELLLPLVPGLAYGDELLLAAPADQVVVT